jgi:hypothetical protein
LAGCFPDLPDVRAVTNLRVLAIQADPATGVLSNPFEPPVVTVRALVVHPDNDDLDGVEHHWGFDFGDEDFDGREVLDALIPDGPHGTSIEIDLAPLFEEREGGWLPLVLPVTYTAQDDELTRDAVKIVSFLLPDPGFFAGDDDDSADPEELLPPEETEAFNLNPTITAVQIGDQRWTGDDLSLDAALDVGAVTTEDGLEFILEYTDDEPTVDLNIQLYWTSGSAGLPPEPSDDRAGFGGRFGRGDEDDEDADLGDGDLFRAEGAGTRTLGWTPSAAEDAPPPRLWIVLRDEQGGQTWQELRPR